MRTPPLLLAAGLLLVTATTGCVAPTEGWAVSGTFQEDAAQADLDDLRDRIRPHDGDLLVMESHPMQFRITTTSQAACEEVRAILGSAGYVDQYGECMRHERTQDGDQATASP